MLGRDERYPIHKTRSQNQRGSGVPFTYEFNVMPGFESQTWGVKEHGKSRVADDDLFEAVRVQS